MHTRPWEGSTGKLGMSWTSGLSHESCSGGYTYRRTEGRTEDSLVTDCAPRCPFHILMGNARVLHP